MSETPGHFTAFWVSRGALAHLLVGKKDSHAIGKCISGLWFKMIWKLTHDRTASTNILFSIKAVFGIKMKEIQKWQIVA